MKTMFALAALALVAFAGPARAQDGEVSGRLHLSPYVGAFVPTGSQRNQFKDAVLVGATASYDMLPYTSVVASFGWAPTEEKGLSRTLDLYQYDLGLQGQYPFDVGHGLTLTPFLGGGIGGRTYEFRNVDIGSETDFAGYFSGGATLQYRQASLSMTARDYISHYNGIGLADVSTTRNDLSLFASIGVRL
jgi:Outer membrane protein beta-barrel domain